MSSRIDLKDALAAADDDPQLLRTLIDLYFEQLPTQLSAIESGLQKQVSKDVERNSHSLKGAISVFGNHPARDAARALEQLGRNSSWNETGPAWEHLLQQLEAMATDLNELKKQLGAADEGE